MDNAFEAPAAENDVRVEPPTTRTQARGRRGYVERSNRRRKNSANFVWINIYSAFYGAFALLMFILGSLALFLNGEFTDPFAYVLPGIGLIVLAIVFGLMKRQRWAIIPSYILSCITILGIPVGTFLSVMFLLSMPKVHHKFS